MTTTSARLTAAVASVAVVTPLAAGAAQGATSGPELDRVLSDSRITESSGIARSTFARDVVFTHNDSGDSARVFAVGADGKTDAVLKLKGASATDWEDISSGPGNTLWVGDLGNDKGSRKTVSAYRFTEPQKLANGSVAATRFNLRYPDGAQHAEALMVHPTTGRVYVVTKRAKGAAIYAAPTKLVAGKNNALTKVGTAPANVTAASFAPNGTTFALATQSTTYVYSGFGATPRTLANPTALKTVESVEIDRTGAKVLVGTEGKKSPVYALPLTTPVAPAPAPKPTPTPEPKPTPTPTPEPTPTPTPEPTPTPTPTPTPEPKPTPTPGKPAGEAPEGWELSYSTTFGNLNGWTVYNNQTQSNDNSINMAKNVTAGPKGLTILGKRESGYNRPFTTGEIVGKSGNLVVPNYFRAEVTGTFEDASGIWPCLLWFRPNNANDGEIDVMEWMGGMWTGDQKRVAVTMHNEYGATQDSIKKPLILKNHSWFDPNAEHTYTVEKVPGSITVWIDGRKISTFTASDKGWWNRIMENKDRTWYPRITLQIGQGASTKVVPNPASSWSSTEVGVTSMKLWTRS